MSVTFWVRENRNKWIARSAGPYVSRMEATSTKGEREAAENWVRRFCGDKYQALDERRCTTTNFNVYSVWSVQKRGES